MISWILQARAGKVEMRREKLDTLHIINETITELQSVVHDKHLSIAVEKPPIPAICICR